MALETEKKQVTKSLCYLTMRAPGRHNVIIDEKVIGQQWWHQKMSRSMFHSQYVCKTRGYITLVNSMPCTSDELWIQFKVIQHYYRRCSFWKFITQEILVRDKFSTSFITRETHFVKGTHGLRHFTADITIITLQWQSPSTEIYWMKGKLHHIPNHSSALKWPRMYFQRRKESTWFSWSVSWWMDASSSDMSIYMYFHREDPATQGRSILWKLIVCGMQYVINSFHSNVCFVDI